MSLEGKGCFIWKVKDCEGGDPEAIASLAAQAGFSHVLVKIADGTFDYNVESPRKTDLVFPLIQALKAREIEAWGWHYVYGDYPSGEGRKAVQRVRELGLDGYVIDAEHQYKEPGKRAAARQFMTQLRAGLPDLPVALSSYRFPSLHPQIPWREFLEKCDYNMPQVYWEFSHNPGAQLDRSLGEFEAMTPRRPVIPVGSAYDRGSWQPSGREIEEFLNTAKSRNLSAVNFWEWARARKPSLADIWAAVETYPWGAGPIPTDVVERLFFALNAGDALQAAGLYTPTAAHVTPARMRNGREAITGWYQTMLRSRLPQATFTLTGYSGDGNSRNFTWTASSSRGSVDDGNDVLGLLDGRIVYHYSSFTVSP